MLTGAVGVPTMFLMFTQSRPRALATLGPAFDADDPATILAPKYRDDLGRSYSDQQSVPFFKGVMLPGLLATAASATLLPAVSPLSSFDRGHFWHDASLGYVQMNLGTLITTIAMKYAVGRLRPDFQDRVRRHYCHEPKVPEGIDCKGVGAALSKRTMSGGHTSFPSGHASMAFANATWASLLVGTALVWGEDRSTTGQAVGIPLLVLLQGVAGYVAYSRVADGRHHVSDVIVGGLLGAGISTLVFARHFDLGTGVPNASRQPSRSPAVTGQYGLSWGGTF